MSKHQLWYLRFEHSTARCRGSPRSGGQGEGVSEKRVVLRYRELLREQGERNDELMSDIDLLQRQIEGLISLLVAKDQRLEALSCPQDFDRCVPLFRLMRRYETAKLRKALIAWERSGLRREIQHKQQAEAGKTLGTLITSQLHRLLSSVWCQLQVPIAIQRVDIHMQTHLLQSGFDAIREKAANSSKIMQIRLHSLLSALSSYRNRCISFDFRHIRAYRPKNWLAALSLLSVQIERRERKAFALWHAASLHANQSKQTCILARNYQFIMQFNRLNQICTQKRQFAVYKWMFVWIFTVKLRKSRVKTGLLLSKAVLKPALSRWMWPKPVPRSLALPLMLRHTIRSHLTSSLHHFRTAIRSHLHEQLSLSVAQLSTSQASAAIQLKQLQAEIASLQATTLQSQSDAERQREQCDLQLQQAEALKSANGRLEEQLGKCVQEKGKLVTAESDLKRQVGCLNDVISTLTQEKSVLAEQLSTKMDYFTAQKLTFDSQITNLEASLASNESRYMQKCKECQSLQSTVLSLQDEIKRITKEKVQFAAKIEELVKDQMQVKGTNSQLAAQVLKLSKEIADLKVGTR